MRRAFVYYKENHVGMVRYDFYTKTTEGYVFEKYTYPEDNDNKTTDVTGIFTLEYSFIFTSFGC